MATKLWFMSQRGPAPFDKLLIRLPKSTWGDNHPIFQPTAFPISGLIQWCQHLLTEFGTLFKNGIDHIGCCLFGTGKIGVMFWKVEQFITNKTDVAQWSFEIWHGVTSVLLIFIISKVTCSLPTLPLACLPGQSSRVEETS